MFTYTFPNIATVQQRGSLHERHQKMIEINRRIGVEDFAFIEIPADFIKNITEENKTGLHLGSMLLSIQQVRKLYSKEKTHTPAIKYILHTEPQLSRSGTRRVTPQLRWYDHEWLENFITHVFNIIDFLEQIPYAIEIHPGTNQMGKNNFPSYANAIDKLYKSLTTKYGLDMFIFIENRTNQIINNGTDMRSFWEYINKQFPHLIKPCGFVLDVQQLFTMTKGNFSSQLEQIPIESLKGCHIHTKHRVPSLDDEINWLMVRNKLLNATDKLHVLPEVHHFNHTERTYLFCKEVLGL